MSTSYTITNLDSRLKSYLETHADELVMDAIFNSKSSEKFQLQTGVTAPQAIVRLDSTIEFGDGKTCGFTAGGSDSFSDRQLVPEYIKVNKEYCPKDLLNTWAHAEVKMAATQQDSIPFEQQILENNAKLTAAEVEKLIWVGDKTNGTGNMAYLDGVYTMIEADITGGVIPAANVIAKGSDTIATRVQKLWLALPANVADKMTIVMSITMFKQLIAEWANANMYHIFETYDGEYRLKLPYANIDVIGIEGLEGVDTILAVNFDELYLGVDGEGDVDDVDFYFDKSDRNFKYVCEFALAVQYVFPEHIFVNE